MSGAQNERILAGRPAIDFVGRVNEAERLMAHARSRNGLLVLAVPGAGTSELLRQTYDRMFLEQKKVAPIYFAIRPIYSSARDISRAFLDEFIRQLIAFRRRDATLVRSVCGLDELAELSLSLGGPWIDRLIQIARGSGSSDDRSMVRTCLGAPVRAASNGERSFLMIDGVHELSHIEGGLSFLEELKDVLSNGGVSFALAGHRRFLHGQMNCGRLELDDFDLKDAGRLVEAFARDNDIAVADASRDLIATQLGGNAGRIGNLVRTAKDSGLDLDTFKNVENAYANSIFGGRIGLEFERAFARACSGPDLERRVLALLFGMQADEARRLEPSLWRRRLQLGEVESESMLERLNVSELIRLTPANVEVMSENVALTDYVAARVRLATAETRASVFGDELAEYIKRAPEIMARTYRSKWSIGLREVLGEFSGQSVPSVLVDYGAFRDELKGAPEAEILEATRESPSITLPRIFFTTTASAFYRPIEEIAESERSAIALGFEASESLEDTDIVWIAAEVESKLEASSDLVEFWCDRLEIAAATCGFPRFRIWLVAPEGFSPEALESLKQRNAYGSSRRQFELLRKSLDVPSLSANELRKNEYEMVIPMGEDAELIAAHAVEEIARRHNFDAHSINQIKTALVEACINASEHSLSPDGKIYQRFRVEEDRVVLTVSNRGLRLGSNAPADEPHEGRRGWGLKLMRRLMDEVTIERVDDGTRIVMTKYLRTA